MNVGVDSSFLVSCYALDVHSRVALELMAPNAGRILASPLHIVEVSTALRARVFRRLSTVEEGREAIGQFQADLLNGLLRQVPMPESVWARALELSRNHSTSLGARSLDILNVAVALELSADTFFTFDRLQARLARAEGLVTPIELP